MSKSLAFWTVGTYFLRLAEVACDELIKGKNAHVVTSNAPTISESDYEELTKWSDHSIGVPVLFNFYHGIELLLKGFIALSEAVPVSHRITELLSDFEKSHPNTDLAKIIARYARNLDPNSPLGKFVAANNIKIDDWYEALKYPESTKGKSFSHFELKYGGTEALPFWQSVQCAAHELRVQAVSLARSLGHT